MTDTTKPSIADTQLGLLVRYALRARWFLPIAAIAGIVAGIGAEAYRRATLSTTYMSEAIAIVRPQAAFRVESGATVVNYMANPDRDAEFLPESLSVVDYALLVKSQDVIDAVAAEYNKNKNPQLGGIDSGALRGYLQAVTKLELRTPYDVRYYPTMQLQARAGTAEMAYELAKIWAAQSQEFCARLTRDVKEKTAEYVRKELEDAKRELDESAPPAGSIEPRLMHDRIMLLSRIDTEARLALANDTPEFAVATAPSQAIAQRSGWPRWSGLVAAIVVAIGVLAAGMLWSIVSDVRRAIDRETA